MVGKGEPATWSTAALRGLLSKIHSRKATDQYWTWATNVTFPVTSHSTNNHLLRNPRALPFADKLYEDAGLFSIRKWYWQIYQKLVQWPWWSCSWLARELSWPEPHREFMICCLEEDESHQTQQGWWPEGHDQSNLSFHKTYAVSLFHRLHSMVHWCSKSCRRRPN